MFPSSHSAKPRRRAVAWPMPPGIAAVLLLCALCCGGCYQEMSRSDPWDWLTEKAAGQGWGVSRGGAASRSADAGFRATALDREGWAILVRSFEGPDARQRAEALRSRMERQLHVPETWVRAEHGQWNVYRGRYGASNEMAARRDLRQTRMLVLDGHRPFEDAALVALGLGGVGLARGDGLSGATGDELDLRSHLSQANYTLQVAFFDEDGGKEYRQAAEAYARQLRQRGEQAFYLHGRTMSLVTVGLFSEQDVPTQRVVGADGVPTVSQSYGPRVRELQTRFPHNLGNGMTLLETSSDGQQREAPSFVVRLPDP
jgi:hypothetical protein